MKSRCSAGQRRRNPAFANAGLSITCPHVGVRGGTESPQRPQYTVLRLEPGIMVIIAVSSHHELLTIDYESPIMRSRVSRIFGLPAAIPADGKAVVSMDRLLTSRASVPSKGRRESARLLRTATLRTAWSFVPSYFSNGTPFEAPSHSEPCTLS